jgi:positive regulator of sigma E activity
VAGATKARAEERVYCEIQNFWEKKTFISRKKLLAAIMLVYLVTLIGFALLADYVIGTALYTAHMAFSYSFCVLLICLSGFFIVRKRAATAQTDSL